MSHPTPTDIFLDLVTAFLTPMFLASTGGDLTHARAAAAHTIAAYNADHPGDLLTIAQVIALGLAVLSSISLSMTSDLSIPLILRLRGNAASLHRAAEQSRRALRTDTTPASAPPKQRQHETPAPPPTPPAASPAPTPPNAVGPAPSRDQQHRQAWATAMAQAARDCTADLASLPPAERRQASMRAAVLSGVARDLLSAQPPPPADFKLARP